MATYKRKAALAALSLTVFGLFAGPLQAAPFCVFEATVPGIQAAFRAGELTSSRLVLDYLARIAVFDNTGPKINSVAEINPDALQIAASLDLKGLSPFYQRGPLYGIPILIKDNINTGDQMRTTGGSLALANSIASSDAFVAKKLRDAGAVLLGKANMSEYAGFLSVGVPGGYSGSGGQVLNPYNLAVDPNGIPILSPSGSSSGSGAAATANLATVTIGTETGGSIIAPASVQGLVGIKPTIGLVSRTGIIPISESQDTAGPMTRTVRDAAIVLGAITGVDPNDPVTYDSVGKAFTDYTQFLDPNGLAGARIGVPRDASDPVNNVYYGNLAPDQVAIVNAAIAKLRELGAIIVEANIPTAGQVGGVESTLPVAVTNPFSPLVGGTTRTSTVFLFEFKKGVNAYLASLGPDAPVHTLSEQISYNNANPQEAIRFGQDLLVASEATSGDLSDPIYTNARAYDLRTAKTEGIDAYLATYDLDAILFPGTSGTGIVDKAGYASVTVPSGFRTTIGNPPQPAPPYPYGITFSGGAFSEPTLIKFAYAYEQATKARRPPASAPSLRPGCATP